MKVLQEWALKVLLSCSVFYYGAGVVVLVIMNVHKHVLPKDKTLEVEF